MPNIKITKAPTEKADCVRKADATISEGKPDRRIDALHAMSPDTIPDVPPAGALLPDTQNDTRTLRAKVQARSS